MTELDLQNSVKNLLKQEILPEISIFEPDEMKVFLQDIPLSTDFEDEDDKYFPCCVVRLRGGEIKTASDPQLTTLELLIFIKDAAEDMSGYQALMAVIQRIRNYLTAHVGIEGKFRLMYPIEWSINEEAAPPYFVGNVVTTWQTDIPPFCDPNDFL